MYKNRRKGGGVAFYIKEIVTFERRLDLENSLTESIWNQINQKKNQNIFSSVVFTSLLRHQSICRKTTMNFCLNDLTLKQNNETFILVDFNINKPAEGWEVSEEY